METRYTCSVQQQPLTSKAGERFARAAEALLAGDRELYEMWLKAAEATVNELHGTGSLGYNSLLPEALARTAQLRQDAADTVKACAVDNTVHATAQDSMQCDAPSAGDKRKWEWSEEV
jgi:hypothetical protein